MILRLLFVCIVLVSQSYGQNNKADKSTYYTWFDQFIGIENTGLYNGIQYVEKYASIRKQHQFFQSRDFVKGSITYNGQSYYNVSLKYNVYEDTVLIRLLDKFGGGILQLNNEGVSNFVIDKHTFVNLYADKKGLKEGGFYETLVENELFSFYKKNRKIKKELFKEDRIIYDFPDKQSYSLFYNNAYHSINSKGDLSTIFPELKKQINEFYNANRVTRKSNPDTFWTLLLKKIYLQISNTHNSKN